MPTAIRIANTTAIVALLATLGFTPHAQAQSACEAAKVKSTGKLFGCLMSLEASAIKQGGLASPTKLAKCDTKFDATCAKGEARGDCSATSYPCAKIRDLVGRAFDFYGRRQCVSAPSGLIAWWPFDEAQGAVGADLSQFTYVWPVNPLAPYPLGSLALHQGGGPVIGRHDNGFNGYATAGAPTAYDPSALTIDAWVDSASFYGTVLYYEDGAGGTYELLWLGGILYFTSTCGGGYHEVYTDPAPPAAGPWTHVAFTIDATGAVAGYADGVPLTTSVSSGTSYNLGACQTGGTWNIALGFSGPIDELEVFQRALDATEVAAIANALKGKCKPPCY